MSKSPHFGLNLAKYLVTLKFTKYLELRLEIALDETEKLSQSPKLKTKVEFRKRNPKCFNATLAPPCINVHNIFKDTFKSLTKKSIGNATNVTGILSMLKNYAGIKIAFIPVKVSTVSRVNKP